MAKITRKTAKLFGTSGPSGDFAQFGSLQAGSAVFTQDPASIQALSAWLQGLTGSVIAVGSEPSVPPLEDMNAAFLVAFYQLAYLLQQGIPEWDGSTTYYQNSYVQVSGTIYKSLTDNNTGNNPTTSTTNWIAPANSAPVGNLYGGVAQNSAIDPVYSFDISACSTKNHTGLYQINAPAITNKSVNSTWVQGSSQGALDTGTIGASPDIVYIFAIGKSTDSTTGDYLYSKSRTSPTMTLPNAAGFDIYRLVGMWYWEGTRFTTGFVKGNGSHREMWLGDAPIILNAGNATTFTDIDVSAYVDGNIATTVKLHINNGTTDFYMRPKGSSASDGTVRIQLNGNVQGEMVINSNAIFQYRRSSAGGGDTTSLYLIGFNMEF